MDSPSLTSIKARSVFVRTMSPSCPESLVQKHCATTIHQVTLINARLGEVRLAPIEALRIAGAKDCFVPDSSNSSAGYHRQQPLQNRLLAREFQAVCCRSDFAAECQLRHQAVSQICRD